MTDLPHGNEREHVTHAARAAHLKWLRGGEGSVVTIDADAVVVRSTVPSPPGSRIEAEVVEAAGRAAPSRFRMKVHACRRQADRDFVLEGKPLDLTRALREHLVLLVGQAPRSQ